jgi:hypothetical protein
MDGPVGRKILTTLITLFPETKLDIDPEHRPVHLFSFNCPVCGTHVNLYGTKGPHFSIPITAIENEKEVSFPFNIWHLDINEEKKIVSISPSIGLHDWPGHNKPTPGHTAQCHLVLTNEPFEWDKEN